MAPALSVAITARTSSGPSGTAIPTTYPSLHASERGLRAVDFSTSPGCPVAPALLLLPPVSDIALPSGLSKLRIRDEKPRNFLANDL